MLRRAQKAKPHCAELRAQRCNALRFCALRPHQFVTRRRKTARRSRAYLLACKRSLCPLENVMRPSLSTCAILALATALALFRIPEGLAEEDYTRWEVLQNPFESTGGGGVMIGGYNP